MKKYFYSNGTEKQGPFSFEELKSENITQETLIWYGGMDDWKPAKDIKELNEFFELIPPPINEIDKNNESENYDFNINIEEVDSVRESTATHYIPKKPAMFKNVFSFDGRIRRLEFGLSAIIYFFYYFLAYLMAISFDVADLLILFLIPGLWFLWAQGAKRCHDMGNNGWFQIIPFYGLWMLFVEGDFGFNKYGVNPKLKC